MTPSLAADRSWRRALPHAFAKPWPVSNNAGLHDGSAPDCLLDWSGCCPGHGNPDAGRRGGSPRRPVPGPADFGPAAACGPITHFSIECPRLCGDTFMLVCIHEAAVNGC
jgi:hypothetical protein